MKKATILLTIFFFISCTSSQDKGNSSEIKHLFNVKGEVKEIQTTSKVLTTMGERNYYTTTTFTKKGHPIETKLFEDGKLKSTEPWVKPNKSEYKEEFDNDKRLIRSTIDRNGITYNTHYKYDSLGNKIEEHNELLGRKTEFIYDSNKLLLDEIQYEKEDEQFYKYNKKSYSYDENLNLIKMLVYYYHYPNEERLSGKYLYKYDSRGSLIKTVLYIENEITEISDRKIQYY